MLIHNGKILSNPRRLKLRRSAIARVLFIRVIRRHNARYLRIWWVLSDNSGATQAIELLEYYLSNLEIRQ